MEDKVELNSDSLVRTCEVAYRVVRCDLPVEELRIYMKGLKTEGTHSEVVCYPSCRGA